MFLRIIVVQLFVVMKVWSIDSWEKLLGVIVTVLSVIVTGVVGFFMGLDRVEQTLRTDLKGIQSSLEVDIGNNTQAILEGFKETGRVHGKLQDTENKIREGMREDYERVDRRIDAFERDFVRIENLDRLLSSKKPSVYPSLSSQQQTEMREWVRQLIEFHKEMELLKEFLKEKP